MHGALSTLTVNACKRMLTLPIKISTYVHLGNKTLALEDTGRPSYGKVITRMTTIIKETQRVGSNTMMVSLITHPQ